MDELILLQRSKLGGRDRRNGRKKGIGCRLWIECKGCDGDCSGISCTGLWIDRWTHFVALVVMALATTVISGLALPWLMKTRPLSQRAWEPMPLHELKGSYNYHES